VIPPYAKSSNTKVNTRDRHAGQKTADQQQNNKSDVDITRDIRKAIVADKSLSTYAHNIKVITVDGKVTLKGPVKTADEKAAIKKIATEAVGAANVVDQIAVDETAAASSSAKTHPTHKPTKVNP
jgi:hyperosmotically inducible protein